MPGSQGTIREIVWRDVFPWLILVRSVRIALQAPQLVLGTGGVLFTIFGWWLIGALFSGTSDLELKNQWVPYYRSCVWRAEPRPVGSLDLDDALHTPRAVRAVELDADEATPSDETQANVVYPDSPWTSPPEIGRFPSVPWIAAWRQLSAPWMQMFAQGLNVTRLAFLLLCALWSVAVWAFFGGAAARMAVVQLAREEKIGLKRAAGFAASKWTSFCGGPLFPMLGVLLAVAPMWLVGLIMRLDVGAAFAALVLWPLLLVGACLIVVLVLGVLFGWPLMWPAIAAEGSDFFDALSRSYSYVYQRPFHYVFYVAVAAFFGTLAALFVHGVVETVVYLPIWATSTAGLERMAKLTGLTPSGGPLFNFAANCIWFWSGCARAVALGFVFAFLWTAASAMYLLLRFEVDGAEMDEVYMEAGAETYGLPPLETDARGVHVAPQAGAETPHAEPPAQHDSPPTEIPLPDGDASDTRVE